MLNNCFQAIYGWRQRRLFFTLCSVQQHLCSARPPDKRPLRKSHPVKGQTRQAFINLAISLFQLSYPLNTNSCRVMSVFTNLMKGLIVWLQILLLYATETSNEWERMSTHLSLRNIDSSIVSPVLWLQRIRRENRCSITAHKQHDEQLSRDMCGNNYAKPVLLHCLPWAVLLQRQVTTIYVAAGCGRHGMPPPACKNPTSQLYS